MWNLVDMDKGIGDYLHDKITPSKSILLPCVHTTTNSSLAKIIASGRLLPSNDEHFEGEKLLYFYYGIPYYMPKGADKIYIDEGLTRAPVCIIVDFASILSNYEIKRIFSFDTGAFDAKLYEKYLDHKLTRDKFYLGKSKEDIQRFIAAFYQTSQNYIQPIFSENGVVLANSACSQYLTMIKNRNNDADERKRIVEVQICEEIDLAKFSTVIMDFNYAHRTDEGQIMQKELAKKSVHVEFYQSYSASTIAAYTERMIGKVFEKIQENINMNESGSNRRIKEKCLVK